jgi:RNA polymerase sigma-70 factor, ECF subfamily
MAESAPSSEVFSLARYRDYLRALARSRLDPRLWARVDPSEVVQEALLKAHCARDQFRGQSEQELAAWLGAILNNTLANSLRACERRKGFSLASLNELAEASETCRGNQLMDPGLPPEELATHNEQLLRLATALSHLPDDSVSSWR